MSSSSLQEKSSGLLEWHSKAPPWILAVFLFCQDDCTQCFNVYVWTLGWIHHFRRPAASDFKSSWRATWHSSALCPFPFLKNGFLTGMRLRQTFLTFWPRSLLDFFFFRFLYKWCVFVTGRYIKCPKIKENKQTITTKNSLSTENTKVQGLNWQVKKQTVFNGKL